MLAPFLGYLWSFCRIFVQAPAGRQRFNVLGALDAISHQLVTVTNDTYINAHSVCQLMQKLRLLNPELPIVLILDNARYQKCTLVWTMASELKIGTTTLNRGTGIKAQIRTLCLANRPNFAYFPLEMAVMKDYVN